MAEQDNLLLNKLAGIEERFEELTQQITDPDVIADQKRYVKLNKEYKELEKLKKAKYEYTEILENLAYTEKVLANEQDEEMLEMAKEELEDLQKRREKMEEEIKMLLVPKDPEDDKSAIMEIRAGTGGDEASIFAGDLYRMYIRYFEDKGWKISVTSFTEGSSGGYKEIVMKIDGNAVYGTLKYESGVHRVQRVPKTETQGRVHTSAASVAVLPEAEEVDVELRDEDVRKDTYCSSGPGGQSVNTTYSAIRLTHIPTGIVVTCQDEKSQLKNLDKAKNELRTRLYNMEYQKKMEERTSQRRSMVSTGDRSAKIRTYNFPQGRITDHRINLTMYNLDSFMNGDIQKAIDELRLVENAERLQETDIDG